MCGIAAIYSATPADEPDLRRRIKAMTDEMAHRGPDADGHYISDHIALGHRRLSILDLSPQGAQPMFSRTTSSNGRYVIVFNGEIYNYLELNAMLQKRGVKAQSHSDTETILNLYELYGESCLEHLRGMFAFVLWDKIEKKLFAARDRFGQKPLLYAKTPNGFVFASELKGVITSGLIEKRLNPEAIDALFETGSVMQPQTMLQGVQMLMPAHALTIHNGKEKIWRYWNVQFPDRDAKTPDYGEAKEELRRLFFETLKQHLISDVPLGVFLSGGIDSSLIVAMMRQMGQETKTYSIGFDTGGEAYNETHHAKQVAERYGTIHTELILSQSDVLNDLDKIVFGIDQPSADGLNSYAVSKAARKYVTVALSGLGSDEVFGGYTMFKFAQRLLALKKITNRVPPFLSAAAMGIDNAMPESVREQWQWRGLVGAMGGYNDTARTYLIRTVTAARERRRLFSKDFSASKDFVHHAGAYHAYRDALNEPAIRNVKHPIQELSFLELNFYMLNTLLRDADAMSMINSLEVRVPFLDHKFVEFAASLPPHFKIDGATKNTGKKILIDAFSDLLPPEIVYRKKMGFVFPLGIWMKTGKFREIIEEATSEKTVRERGIFNYVELQKLTKAFFSGGDDSTQNYRAYLKVWLVTLTELWLRRFM
jgi:asparagine synthase (glutamine-hydrolysing)